MRKGVLGWLKGEIAGIEWDFLLLVVAEIFRFRILNHYFL
jgi:hypothetical protein